MLSSSSDAFDEVEPPGDVIPADLDAGTGCIIQMYNNSSSGHTYNVRGLLICRRKV